MVAGEGGGNTLIGAYITSVAIIPSFCSELNYVVALRGGRRSQQLGVIWDHNVAKNSLWTTPLLEFNLICIV